jgi:hypothetical protein
MTSFDDTPSTAISEVQENGIGSDLAYRIDPLTDQDWKDINAGLDRRFSGLFISGVNSKELPWRGTHHLAAMSLFELDPAIDQFEVMPERITVTIDGKRRRYIPAFRLLCGRTVLMVDVLHVGQEKHPKRAEVTETLRMAYGCRGIRYKTIPERRVFAQPRQRNARYVLEYRSVHPAAETEMAVVKALAKHGKHTVDSVVATLADYPDGRDALLALATQRRVKLDLWAATPGEMTASLLSWKGLS